MSRSHSFWRVLTGERGVVLNAVVHINIAEVELACPIVSGKHVGRVFGDEEAERRGKVIRRTNFGVQFAECDVSPVTWKYACK